MSAHHRAAKLLSHLQVSEQKNVESNATGFAKAPVKVVVTGAAGNIGYAAVFMIGQGAMLGPDQPISLYLLDIPQAEAALNGVYMELMDAAFPLLTSIVPTTSYEAAFKDCDVALLIGARPRGKGMDRKDLLKANAKIFDGQGKALNAFASPDVKVIVVGNPCNTNALITKTYSPDLGDHQITAMTRLDELRAKGQIAARIGVEPDNVRNIVIWGNHSKTQYPDVNHGFVVDYPNKGQTTSIREAVADDAWLNGAFIKTVQTRGAAVIKARGKSSAASAANAAISHIRTWVTGTRPGEIRSMAVVSDGSYGVPKGLVYSFPVTCDNGRWNIVQGLKIDGFSQGLMDATRKELIGEKAAAGL
eukprot:CAMPEP_0205821680 /NCGR_PEP_ID=MMETSP0206-20130828/8854_1 /ASSEMBLY_ACC=CAM_ASM_000279 /TAXON_ID=36767 /ORGANISM="Euplotes focardii, Strain TN1" /LENGTH=360 /DNA_ID=CAMNT_0053117341 /DNA_START=17 /DNA_END=1099 /DNA_ORIENTATION=+